MVPVAYANVRPNNTMSVPSSPLLVLAPELVVEILENLDYLSLLRCQQTCQKLYSLIKGNSKLQYILELDIYRLDENSISGPYSERLDYLRNYLRKWECLDFSSVISTPTDSSSIAYDFAEGAYVQLLQSGDVVTHHVPSTKNTTFTAQRQNIYQSMGLSEDNQRIAKDLAIDPSQDFIVWYERINLTDAAGHIVLHFRTLSNVELVHPEASVPLWDPHIDERNFYRSDANEDATLWIDVELHIFQDLLAVSVEINTWPRDEEWRGFLLIWNWKLGALVFDSRIHPLGMKPSKHALVGRDTLLVSSTEGSGSISLYRFQPTPSPTASPYLLTVFHLPPLHDQSQCSIYSAQVQTTPYVQSATSAFSPRFEESILTVTPIYMTLATDTPNPSYTLFVHLSTLFNYSKNQVDLHMKWDEWGPRNTRLLQRVTPGGWTGFVHGQKVAGARPNVCRNITIFDFSPYPRSSDELNPKVSESDLSQCFSDEGDGMEPGSVFSGYIGRDQPTVFSKSRGFSEDVITSLPFRFVIRKPQEMVSARWFMLDGERMIASVTENGFTQEGLRAYVL